MAKLTPDQHAAVEQWAAEGATLNDIQQRLKTQFGISITYLDARLLVMDLNVQIKDKERAKEPDAASPTPSAAPGTTAPAGAEPSGLPSDVTVTLDDLAISGAMCSGKVTFSDGKSAGWYIDQTGRLGLRASEPGYQPPPADVPVFQEELERVLAAAGM